MADTVTTHYIWPPNWDGNAPERGGWRKVSFQLTGISDGTGETAVRKLDISELRTTNGLVPTRTVIEKIEYAVDGYDYVKLYWDRAAADTIAVLAGQGVLDWINRGGKADGSEAEDRTGDIMLTSSSNGAGDVYDITITLRLKET